MKNINRPVAFFVLFLFVLQLFPLPQKVRGAWREPVRARHAMVAAQHELASKIGVEVLKKGGNAVDAAIAVALALAVVYPEAGNLGGGGFMLIRFKDGRATGIDYREMAPLAASRNVFVDKEGNLIKGEGSSTVGYRASGVPGTPAGLDLAYQKYGSKKILWKDLVEPARALAQNGYVLSFRLAELFKSYQSTLEKYEDSKKIFLNGGKLFEEGDSLKQPELALTLGRIQKFGAKEFYTGQTAKLIADD
ncbi:MAG TPA: gamma-glutamyltransferase, partial [Pyrinomonadaceae bacterium]